uniref:SAM domain-containing protein n=1 Tax=Wuchereria bancrofti TaxID=6293 RepID=A0A1I8EJV3_WUCBA
MSIKEKLKCARTTEEVLFILNMSEYLPLFAKANIVQASALRLLREADLKCIGIDSSGRQKLLRAIRYLSKNISVTIGDRIRQKIYYAANIESKYSKINEKFCLQKAEDELLRCEVELNLKRNELARIQKQAKLIREIFEMTSDARQYVEKLRKNCDKYGSLSVQRLAVDLESLLNNTFLKNANSNPSNVCCTLITFYENISPLAVVQNTNSCCTNTQRYLPESLLKPLTKHNTRLYCSTETGPGPWYAKILKSTAIRRYKQVPCSSPALIYYHPVDDERYQETTISLSTQTSQYEHASFVDGLFSKFGKNKTSTPYKQHSSVKQYSSNTSNLRHQSLLHHSHQKVKNVFMKASRC